MSGKTKVHDFFWLYGHHPVINAVNSGKRKLKRLIVTKEAVHRIDQSQLPKDLRLEIVDKKEIERNLPKFATHQGFALLATAIPFQNFDIFYKELMKMDEKPKLLILDQITDPHNLGAIIRSAVAFGFCHIIIPSRQSASDNGTISKSSSGMIEYASIFQAGNLASVLNSLKELGYWRIVLDGGADSDNLNKIVVQKYKPLALVIGSEGSGARRLTKVNCDIAARIEMSPSVESLNASVAAAIAMRDLS